MSGQSWPHGAGTRGRIAAHLARRPTREAAAEGRRRAAVALVLLPGPGGAETAFLLTRRASRLARHAGQYALPGGRLDPGETALDAALRELDEELGIAAGPADVLGRLDDLPTASGYLIAPFVLWLGQADTPRPDPAEVAAVHYVPLVELFTPPDAPMPRRIAPEPGALWLHLPTLGHEVYAPTAAVLHQFREVALLGRDSAMPAFREPGFARR
ncbi:MAG TPA: CoA pyrophosphatase [Thermohalobaculum sp.]|nr:CoA pyrophosphatase [Thermohalobaculum sp.]